MIPRCRGPMMCRLEVVNQIKFVWALESLTTLAQYSVLTMVLSERGNWHLGRLPETQEYREAQCYTGIERCTGYTANDKSEEPRRMQARCVGRELDPERPY